MTTLPQLYRTSFFADALKAKAIRRSQGLCSSFASTRVKRRGSNVNRENPCNAGSETAERAAEMRGALPKFTALLSPQENV